MKSMTGFGRASVSRDGWRMTVELSSVNRKQSDISFHLPRSLMELEGPLRQLIAASVSRGRITVSLAVEPLGEGASGLSVNRSVADAYFSGIRSLCGELGIPFDLRAGDLLRVPGLFTDLTSTLRPEEVKSVLEEVVRQALAALDGSREAEGVALRKDVESKLAELARLVAKVRERAPEVLEHHRTALQKRLRLAGLDVLIDDERLVKEIAVLSDKTSIDEEVIRFESHLQQFATTLGAGTPQGRTLDFLCQELHRELNTMSAKANDPELAYLVVAAKTEAEKLREQVQNIE